METTKFSVGIFFKNPLGVVGSRKEKIPFLTKTLANLVFMPDGTDVETTLGNKVDKIQGKGLSTNDYTTAEKNKLTEAYSKEDIDGMLNGCRLEVIDGILRIYYNET